MSFYERNTEMKRTASEILNQLELRVARLERTSARPSMSPRRLIDEGLLEVSQDRKPKQFKHFDLNEKSILEFLKNKLHTWESLGFDKVVAVDVSAYRPFQVSLWVKTVSMHQGKYNYSEMDEYTSHSFDADIDSKGNVKKVVRDEEHDLTHAQYSRLERNPVDINIDFDALRRHFPGFIFNK